MIDVILQRGLSVQHIDQYHIWVHFQQTELYKHLANLKDCLLKDCLFLNFLKIRGQSGYKQVRVVRAKVCQKFLPSSISLQGTAL